MKIVIPFIISLSFYLYMRFGIPSIYRNSTDFVEISVLPKRQRLCANKMAKYYEDHATDWKHFRGEAPGSIFKKYLNSIYSNSEEDIYVVDVGANQGQILEFFPDVENIFFTMIEPNPVLAERLQSSNLEKVKIFPIALSNQSGVGMFSKADVSENGRLHKHGKFKVNVSTLDDISNELPERIHLLKIDGEGFDVQIIKGGMETISNRVDVLLYECHYLQYAEYNGPGTSVRESVKILNGLGFDVFRAHLIYKIQMNGPYWDERYDAVKTWTNCFAVHRDTTFRDKILNNYFELC